MYQSLVETNWFLLAFEVFYADLTQSMGGGGGGWGVVAAKILKTIVKCRTVKKMYMY
jgi:hypothetical protein